MTISDHSTELKLTWEPTDADSYQQFAVEFAPDMLVVVDPDYHVVWSNGAVTQILGYSEGEMIGTPVWEFIHPEDLEQAVGAGSESLRNDGYHLATRLRLRRADGSYVDTRSTATTQTLHGRTWMTLSVRVVEDEVAIEKRRRRLKSLAQTFYINCAAMHWYEERERSRSLLGSLAAVVGASSVVLAESVSESLIDRSAELSDLTVVSAWSADVTQEHVVGEPCDVLADPVALRDLPCVAALEAAGPGGATEAMVIEMALDGDDAVRGMARLGFDARSLDWDDANADLVALMCSTLLATVDRCRGERRVNEEARLDPLTRLLNRSALMDHLTVVLQSGASHTPPVVLFADLNKFKILNDTQGHRIGDHALQAAAEGIRSSIREDDVAARIGGDEFVIVFRAPEESSGQLVARVRTAVDNALGRWPGLTVAVGAIVVGPNDSPVDVIERADLAMYSDKHGTAARVSTFGEAERRATEVVASNGELASTDVVLEVRAQPLGLRESGITDRLLEAWGRAVDVMLVLDAGGVIQLASPSVPSVFGFTAEEAVGRNAFELVHPDDHLEAVESFVVANSSPGEKAPLCLRIHDAFGQWRPVEVAAVNCLDEPAIGGIVLTVRDRTGEDVAAAITRYREDAYRQIVELAAEGIWMSDESRTTTFVTTRMASLIGRSQEEILGRATIDFVAERDRERATLHGDRTRLGITAETELSLLHANGSEVPVRMVTTPVLGRDRKFIGIIGMVSDMTAVLNDERRRTEEEVAWRTLLARVSGVVMRCSAGGVVLECVSMMPGLGWGGAESVVGRRIDDVFDDTDALLLPVLRSAIAANEAGLVLHDVMVGDSLATMEIHVVPVDGGAMVATSSIVPGALSE